MNVCFIIPIHEPDFKYVKDILLTKEGRKLAMKQIKDSLGSIRATVPEGGTGNLPKEGENRYGW